MASTDSPQLISLFHHFQHGRENRRHLCGTVLLLSLAVLITGTNALSEPLEPLGCSDFASPQTPVINAVLGCKADGSIAIDFPALDWPRILPGLSDQELMLARVTFLLPNKSYPARGELLGYFEQRGGGDYSVADILILEALWSQSDFWGKILLEEGADSDIGPEAHFLREALILVVLSWFEDDRASNEELIRLRERAFIAEETLRRSSLPWGKAALAYALHSGGLVAKDDALAEQILQDHARWVPGANRRLFLWEDDAAVQASEESLAYHLTWADLGELRVTTTVWLSSDNFDPVAAKYQFGNPATALKNAAIYGFPAAVYQLAEAYKHAYAPFRKNTMRSKQLTITAARWGLEDAGDEVIRSAIKERNYELAFQLALYNAAIGYVTFEDFGFQLASVMAELAFESNDAEKWQDVLAASCRSALTLHSDPSFCPAPSTSNTYEAVPTRSLVSLTADEIRALGVYKLNTGRYKALLIGNQNYSNWTSLTTPHADVKNLGAILEAQYGFDVSYVKDGTRREILQEIYRLGQQSSFEDHVLVYYAGHGVIDPISQEAYWVPTDASRDFAPDWVSADEIKNAFRAISARHLALIADSCYSGKLLRGDEITVPDPTESAIKRLFSKKARVALTSGGEEPVSDSTADGLHSIFAKALLETLQNNDSPLPASTLYEKILGEVTLEAAQTPQYAGMRELDHDGGDFIFVPADWR